MRRRERFHATAMVSVSDGLCSISWDRHTGLCVLYRGTLNARRCIDEIHHAHVRLYAGAIGNLF